MLGKSCSAQGKSSLSPRLCPKGWAGSSSPWRAVRCALGWDQENPFPDPCLTASYFQVISSTDTWLLAAAHTCGFEVGAITSAPLLAVVIYDSLLAITSAFSNYWPDFIWITWCLWTIVVTESAPLTKLWAQVGRIKVSVRKVMRTKVRKVIRKDGLCEWDRKMGFFSKKEIPNEQRASRAETVPDVQHPIKSLGIYLLSWEHQQELFFFCLSGLFCSTLGWSDLVRAEKKMWFS